MNVLVAVAEAVNVPTIVEVEVEALEFLVVAAGDVPMVDLMVVPMVVLSEIKYERSSSFLAKSFLAKKLFCLDFGIWLPRCFGYEKETEEKEKEEAEGERKWMALFKDLICLLYTSPSPRD